VTVLDYLFAVIPMLGILIFVHELGHFIVAKLCGVRVLKFSLGFGPPIGIGRMRMRWVKGGTEYVVAWFPLGGFVKMLGEHLHGDEPEGSEVVDARPDEYLTAKPTWQKLAISFAGPAMNLLLPVVAFAALLWVGIPKPLAVVGMVEPQSPAEQAGLLPGDRVVELDGTPIVWWNEVLEGVRSRTQGSLSMLVERGGERIALDVPISRSAARDEFGGVQAVGRVGIDNRRLPAVLGVPSADSRAAAVGLRSGDRVVGFEGAEIEDWEQLRRAYAAARSGSVALEVLRPEPGEPPIAGAEGVEPIRFEVPALGELEALGLVPATVLVQSVSEGLPADRAGLEAGDLILTVDGRPVGSFGSFVEFVRTSGGRPLVITYARDGEATTVEIIPEEATVPGPLGIRGMDEQAFVIGTRHLPATLPGLQELDRERNPLVAVPRAVAMTIDETVFFLRGLGRLFTGKVGVDKLAGPIGIAEIARKTLDLGWMVYLRAMILISINLAILNLLPIPILDGGQALIFAVEGIQRSPITLQTRERIQGLGLTMILMLMGLAFWNDLSRHWSTFVEWLRGTGL